MATVVAVMGGLRRFVLVRDRDVSGISGCGVVVWGACFPDGTVAYRWNSDMPTTSVAESVERVEAIHGHGGATRLVWLDSAEDGAAWLLHDLSADGRWPSWLFF